MQAYFDKSGFKYSCTFNWLYLSTVFSVLVQFVVLYMYLYFTNMYTLENIQHKYICQILYIIKCSTFVGILLKKGHTNLVIVLCLENIVTRVKQK